jgi:ATP-dependent helicase/nuclease subunit A
MDNISADFDTANVISENENVIRLMSIHKSKGLEFPVVIIARSNRQMVSQETKNDFVIHKDFGIGTNYIDYENRVKSNTISKWVISKKKSDENLAEEMRILYVAMTRTIDKLIIFGTYGKGFTKHIDEWTMKNSKEFLNTSKSYIDWIMRIISKNKGCKKVYEIIDREFYGDGNDLFNLNIVNLNDIEKTNVEEKNNFSEIKDKLVNGDIKINERIDEIFNYEYKSINKKIPTKISVTDLKTVTTENFENFKLFSNIPQLQKEPNFVIEKEGLSPFDIGNTYHFIMEKIDLKRVSLKEIEKQIEEFVKIGYIDNRQKEILNVNSIFNFYNSEVGKRLLKSKEIKREIPFTYKYKENLLVQGIVDLYFEEGNDLIIVDYKTDKINASNERLLLDEHKNQLKIYADALEILTNKKVIGKYLYFFRNNMLYEV